jgi:hypothetical protein
MSIAWFEDFEIKVNIWLIFIGGVPIKKEKENFKICLAQTWLLGLFYLYFMDECWHIFLGISDIVNNHT